MEEALRPILERRSCRQYTGQPVSDEVLRTLLQAGMNAPSAKNSQPWEFLVLRDETLKAAVSAAGTYWGMLKDAPLGIVVLANLEGYRSSHAGFFIQDCSAATENILLAAQAMGLGGVWLGLYPNEERVAAVRSICGIPESIIPVTLTSIGYPAQMPHPHTTFHEEKVHYDRY
jgi:nitroreductase